MKLFKKCIAECIGTFVLVFVACGVAAATGGSVNGGTITATALAFGLVIVAMAYSIGRISGCHINPAVSLACLLTKRMTFKEFLAYVGAQLIGGVLGGIAIIGFGKMGNFDFVGNACNNVIGGDVNVSSVFGSIFLEVVLTFIFVYVILNVTAEKSGFGKIAGIIIGATLTLVHLIGIPLTGTSVNPARSFGTAVADAIFNGNIQPLEVVGIFFVGPLLGGALAALVYKLMHKEDFETSLEVSQNKEETK